MDGFNATTIEAKVADFASKIDAGTVKLFYSAVIGYLGFITLGLYGAASGPAVYFFANLSRIKAALWPIVGSFLSYKMGRKDFALVMLAIAVFLYCKSG